MNFDGMDLLTPEAWVRVKAGIITLAAFVVICTSAVYPAVFFGCVLLLIVALTLRLIYGIAHDHFSFKRKS